VQVPKHPQKDLLGHVFGIFAMAQHAETETEHRSLIPGNERAHRRLVAGKAVLNQIGIIGSHKETRAFW